MRTSLLHAALLGACLLAAPAGAQVRPDSARADTAKADTTRKAPVLAPVVVTSTRSEKRIEDEPMRVEVLAGEDVGEKTEMRPADIRMLLSEMAGVRVQTTAPSTGASVIRVQGLPGRHTLLLSDGLPLYGSYGGGLSLVQLPPVDLKQVEVIKGAASALYGPQAMGGVVNLVSRRPRDTSQAMINATTQGGIDGLLFLARPTSDSKGFTLLAGGHHQRHFDVDHDGWWDVPGFSRAELRPRWFGSGAGGSLMVTAGGFAEDRTGGGRIAAGAEGSYRERLASRHGDVGLVGRRRLSPTLTLSARASAALDDRRRSYGAVEEHDRNAVGFGEATLSRLSSFGMSVLGGAAQRDDYRNDAAPRFDLPNSTGSLFAQQTVEPVQWLGITVNGRCDATSRFGTICTPRGSLLLRGGGMIVRASAGAGWFAPSSRIDETEGVYLGTVGLPRPLEPERGRTTSLDVGYTHGAWQLNATAFDNRVRSPLRLVDQRPVDGGFVLENVAGDYTARGTELFAVYQGEPWLVTAYWAAVRAHELDPLSGMRVAAPLVPSTEGALDIGFEEDDTGTYVAVEAFYTGPQALEMDPYRGRSPRYVVFGAMVRQRFGWGWAYVNFENLGDTRQTRWSPLLPPAGGATAPGQRTVSAWGPLEGRVVNAGVRLTF